MMILFFSFCVARFDYAQQLTVEFDFAATPEFHIARHFFKKWYDVNM